MKNKLIFVAIIGMLLVTGVILASCGIGCPGDGKCNLDPDDPLTYLSNCGLKVKTGKEAEKAIECKVYKAGLTFATQTKKVSCDC